MFCSKCIMPYVVMSDVVPIHIKCLVCICKPVETYSNFIKVNLDFSHLYTVWLFWSFNHAQVLLDSNNTTINVYFFS